MEAAMTHENQCFVIMPFGQRNIDNRAYDFDVIYRNIFTLAIENISLPNGRKLQPKRADSPNTPGIITQEMFRDILYSRIVLADITGLNPNVFYELGVRHTLRPTSTVVFKEIHSTIPFDVRDLRIFSYDMSDLAGIGAAITFIRKCLEESLASSVLDSPVVASLREYIDWPTVDPEPQSRYTLRSWVERQREQEAVDAYVQESKSAIQRGDLPAAEASLYGALTVHPNDLVVNMDLAVLLRDRGNFGAAESILSSMTRTHPSYASAWRELGIAQNKLNKANDAVVTLKHAVELNVHDADAWSSLGGVYKKLQQFGSAQDAYLKALELTPGNPYPLLNYMTLHAQNNHALPPREQFERSLARAEATSLAEVTAQKNLPWSYFDLAQILFFRGDQAGFEDRFRAGAAAATADWQINSARETYELLDKSGVREPDARAALRFTQSVASGT
jgi:Flp pilus assembly protein TadD